MQTVDLLNADVRCSAIVWTSENEHRVKNPEKHICGVVDESVPFPLLRAVFRTAPASEEITGIWNRSMKNGAENGECGMYVSSYREKSYVSRPESKTIQRREVVKDVVFDAFNAFSTSIVGAKRFVRRWNATNSINLSSIVAETAATALIDTMPIDLATIRLYYANRYSILFGAFNLVFEKLDMSTATVGERVAKCIFADVLAKRIHKRPRSYGWYVVKQYFMPIWGLRNWLWKTTIAKKYAPGGVGFLEDRDAAAMFVDLDAVEMPFELPSDCMVYDELDDEFDRILGKRDRERASDDPVTTLPRKRHVGRLCDPLASSVMRSIEF